MLECGNFRLQCGSGCFRHEGAEGPLYAFLLWARMACSTIFRFPFGEEQFLRVPLARRERWFFERNALHAIAASLSLAHNGTDHALYTLA